MFCIAYFKILHILKHTYNTIDRSKPATVQPAKIHAQHFRNKLINEWKSCVNFNDVDCPHIVNSSISTSFDSIKAATTFGKLIQLLSEISSDTDDDNVDENQMESTESNWKYEIIRQIGAPWNWIYEFVSQCQPKSHSYNFHECKHELENTELLIDMNTLTSFETANIPSGIRLSSSSPISSHIIEAFLNYAKVKAMENDGLIYYSKDFKAENCPSMC